MAVTTIPWGDGSGDNIYLTRNASEGDQTVVVTSDANTGAARSKVVTFATGSITRQLTVNQEAGVSEQTITVNPSSYDQTNTVYRTIASGFPITDGYTDTTSNSSCHATFVNGAGAETKFYWKFDLSSIPAGATINSVTLKVRALASAASSPTIDTQYLAVCNGTTEVGTHQSVTNAATVYTLDTGSGWTRATIQDIAVLFYTKRGTSNTSKSYYQAFFGAELTVNYTL